MNIITWNVNGYKSAYEKGDFKKLYELNSDIICIQEVKNSDIEYIKSTVPNMYNIYINNSIKKGHNGVAIITRYMPKNIMTKININQFDAEGRILCLEFDKVILYNLYMIHGGRDQSNLKYKLEVCNELLKTLKEKINEDKSKAIIVATDFNIAHQDIDLARPKQNRKNIMFTTEERKIVDEIINIGFIDSFRFVCKEQGFYTWWPYSFNARNRNIGWRIDYIFVNNDLSSSIKSVNILSNIYGSDHCPMQLILEI